MSKVIIKNNYKHIKLNFKTKKSLEKIFKTFVISLIYPLKWCGREDLNPHGLPIDPKSIASASSATPADYFFIKEIFQRRFFKTKEKIV